MKKLRKYLIRSRMVSDGEQSQKSSVLKAFFNNLLIQDEFFLFSCSSQLMVSLVIQKLHKKLLTLEILPAATIIFKTISNLFSILLLQEKLLLWTT